MEPSLIEISPTLTPSSTKSAVTPPEVPLPSSTLPPQMFTSPTAEPKKPGKLNFSVFGERDRDSESFLSIALCSSMVEVSVLDSCSFSFSGYCRYVLVATVHVMCICSSSSLVLSMEAQD